jgi:hypothetical protein
MSFLYVLAAIALAYLVGGLLTTIAASVILWSQSRKITLRDLAVLPKVFVLWPAVVAMGVVFAVIMLAQRRHFAQEARKAAKKNRDGPVA